MLQRNDVQVWDINEYRMIKMCHKCQRADREMHKVKLKPTDEEAVPCYNVLHYTECQVFVQRDVNASLNILRLTRCKLEGQARPNYLCRNALEGVIPPNTTGVQEPDGTE